MIYNFYIFDRAGQCLVFSSWNQCLLTQKAINNRCKLVFGLLYTLKAFTNKITPHELDELEKENFHTMTTPEYKLHCFETLTNLRFVLTSDVNCPPLTELLKHIYSLFTTHVIRSPYYTPGLPPTDTTVFNEELTKALQAHIN